MSSCTWGKQKALRGNQQIPTPSMKLMLRFHTWDTTPLSDPVSVSAKPKIKVSKVKLIARCLVPKLV
jgi:hypothetical protein